MFLTALALSLTTGTCSLVDGGLPTRLSAWATPGHGTPGDLSKPIVLMSRDPEALAKEGIQSEAVASESPLEWVERLRREEPAQTGGAASIGIMIERAGVYGVALDQRAEVQVSGTGTTAFSPASIVDGPACSSIVKVAHFRLKPGLYMLELSDLEKPSVKVMLVGS